MDDLVDRERIGRLLGRLVDMGGLNNGLIRGGWMDGLVEREKECWVD